MFLCELKDVLTISDKAEQKKLEWSIVSMNF